MSNYAEKAFARDAESENDKRMPAWNVRPLSMAQRKNDFYYNPIWITDVSREWENVLHLARYVTFKAKEYIPSSIDGEPGFYYLKYGKAKAIYESASPTYSGEETKVTLYHMGEGTLLYDLAAHDQTAHYNMYALTPCETYFFTSSQFLSESFTSLYPQLTLSLVRSQALKNMYYMRRIVSIAGGNAFANTCKLMLELSRSYGNALDVPLGVTHEEIASLLCVRRSWLGKILRRLKDEEVISRCTKARLVISDLDKLAYYATAI